MIPKRPTQTIAVRVPLDMLKMIDAERARLASNLGSITRGATVRALLAGLLRRRSLAPQPARRDAPDTVLSGGAGRMTRTPIDRPVSAGFGSLGMGDTLGVLVGGTP